MNRLSSITRSLEATAARAPRARAARAVRFVGTRSKCHPAVAARPSTSRVRTRPRTRTGDGWAASRRTRRRAWRSALPSRAAGAAARGGGSGGMGGVAEPSIGWTGRINTDPLNTMGPGESVIDAGSKAEGDAYGYGRGRWGDYSNMTIDPSDDCTFWYTQEVYDTTSSDN